MCTFFIFAHLNLTHTWASILSRYYAMLCMCINYIYIEEMMKVVDLETMSTKQFIAALSDKFNGVDLSSKKKYIKATITEIIDSMESDDDDDQPAAASEEVESSSEEEEEPQPKKRRGGGGGGLAAIKEISVDLANFLGMGRMMARTEIVKKMWEYIKEVRC